MFCGKCGTPVDDDLSVCPNCGNDLKVGDDKKELQGINVFQKISKKHIIIACVLVVIIAIPMVYFSMPSTKIINCLKDGDYEDAEELYYDNYEDGEGDLFLNKGLISIAEKCEEDFINSNIDSENAFELMNTIRNIGVNDIEKDIDKIYSSISNLSSDRAIIERAEEYYKAGSYFMAISEYNSLSKDSPLYDGVLAKIEEVKAEYKNKVLEEIDTYINDDKPKDLANYINSNINSLNDSDISSEIMNKYYSYLQAKTDKLLAEDLYDDAVSTLDYAKSYFADDKKIKEMADNIESSYVNSSLKKAEDAFNNGNYEVAASTVQIAMGQVEDNEQLSNKYNEYKAYLPAYINDLDYFNKNGNIYTNSDFDKIADNTGKEYGRAYCIDAYGRDAYSAEYLINGNYTNFEGVCGVAYEERTTEHTKFFEVYGDGILLYKSPIFKAGTMPSNFNIDISNVKILKILYPNSDGKNKIASIFDGKVYNKNNVGKKENKANTSEATS